MLLPGESATAEKRLQLVKGQVEAGRRLIFYMFAAFWVEAWDGLVKGCTCEVFVFFWPGMWYQGVAKAPSFNAT